jgi:multicomponent Na+:H+ antiporter subunit A
MALLWIVFAPAMAAFVLAAVPRAARVAAAVPALIFLYLLTGQSEGTAYTLEWVPSMGVSLSFFMDGLGLVFALLISGIGALVLLYSSAYFDEPDEFARFSRYTLLFMMAMLGIVLSANLLLVFVFWEITSITSYLLIGFKHEKEAARDGARRALVITGAGGLAMMAGFLLMGMAAGTFDLPTILSSGDVLRESPLYLPMLALVLAGAFSKSAQWPLHFWLPGAMEAPTPASTYLHSATMVKAGVFLLARLGASLNGTDAWFYTVTLVGLITFVYAGVMALRQTDLKAILAYSTVSWLGVLVALQGYGSQYAASALVIGVMAHALYKGALFLVAGSVDHATGTRDIRLLGQLRQKMPYTFAGAVIAGVSMAGIPPLLGFLSKELLKAASIYEGLYGIVATLFPIAAVVGSALTAAVALRLVWDTFLGSKPAETPHEAHEAPLAMWIGPVALGAFSIILPFLLAPVLDPLVSKAVSAIRQQPATIHLHLFEGINTPFIMSVIAIAGGVALFLARQPVMAWLQARREFNPDAVYKWLFYRAVPDGAEWLTSRLQSGKLRYYMMIVIAAFITMSLLTIYAGQINLLGEDVLNGLDWEIVVICALLMVGAAAGIAAPTRLSAIAILGIEGALLSLLFALFGAPDLAFTQLMIEVITLVLFVLAFHFLPDAFTSPIRLGARVMDALTAAGAGLAVTLVILAARSNRVGESISSWFINNAVPVGQGHNIVNVILVDFRGMDTQGEITVLVIAAMGVTALLRLRPHDQPRGKYVAAKDAPEDGAEG